MNYRLSLAAAACLLPWTSRATSEEIRYEWDSVPNASYYRGTVKRPDGDLSRFRTSGTWLLFQEGSVVELESMGSDDEPIGPVKLRGAIPEAPPPPPPPAEEEIDAPPAPAPTPEPEIQPEPVAEIHREGPRDGGHVALHLGIGKEWIEAKGGITDYNGSTSIGGTTLEAEKQSVGSPWVFAAEMSAHNFTTSTTEENTGGGTTKETESKFLRLGVRLSASYDFNAANPSYRVAAGLGVAYLRMPLLLVDDDVTGAAKLENSTAMGPFLSVSYLRYLSAVHTFGAQVEYLPMTLSKDVKGNGTRLLLAWRYAFVQNLYAGVGLVNDRTNVSTSVDCPNVTGCEENSTASANVLAARMGIGYVW